MIVPDGLVVPPIAYVGLLSFGAVAVTALLLVLRPPVTSWTVVALTPWMAIGGILHALEVIGAFEPLYAPLFEAPAVYVTTYVLAGSIWLPATVLTAGGRTAGPDRILGSVGGGIAFAFTGIVFWEGYQAGILEPFWPVVGLVLSGVVTVAAVIPFALRYTDAMAITEKAGIVVVFGHVLDGVSTAIGIDALDAGERSPLPRAIMEFAGDLPTAPYIGEGWLFVVVKIVLALTIIALFAEYVRERPVRGYLALAVVAAVGLGPGAHNLLLFLVSG